MEFNIMEKRSKKFKIFRLLCLLGYLVCTAVLIFESCMDGPSSANQSNTVGGTLANIFNDLSGDQTTIVPPEEVIINNKIDTAYVGESYKLNTDVLPENSTYMSLIYSSNDESIATINDEGIISFIKEGEVTITAYNSHYTDIKDTMKVNVKNVLAESITAKINNLNPDEEGIYNLYLGTEYSIITTFNPNNTTDKNLSYSVDTSGYISISSDGIITPLLQTLDSQLQITVTHQVNSEQSLTSIIKVKVKERSVIEPTDINVSEDNVSLYVTQSKSLTVTFIPSNTTYKNYTMTSSDDNIVTISGNSIRGKAPGNATVTIQSVYYEHLTKVVNVEVMAQPEMTSFNATLSGDIIVGATKKISLGSYQPQYCLVPTFTYSSSDTAIATVDNKGNVKGISVGTATISITGNGITKNVTASIKAKPVEEQVGYFEVSQTKDIVYCKEDINLSSIFTGTNWKTAENGNSLNPSNKTLSFAITSDNVEDYSLNGNTLIINRPGTYEIQITHVNSGISRLAYLYSYYDFNITLDRPNTNINVGESFTFTISDNQEENQIYQLYDINNTNDSIISISDYYDEENNLVKGKYLVTSLAEGSSNIIISPIITGTIKNDFAKTISITSTHILAHALEVDGYNNKTEKDIDLSSDKLSMYLNDSITLKPIVDANATIQAIEYLSSDESIISIDNTGLLIPHKIGKAKITIKESYSDLSREIEITIYNKIALIEDNNIVLTGPKISYNKEKERYILTNGFSASINILFTEDSTYTAVQYYSSNEKVLTVGKDGILTPVSVGTSLITIVIDDGMLERISLSITIEVVRQDLITDLSKFFLKVRKSLGHFGAFLVFGICSTFTYLLYFDKKKWFFSVPLNIAQGFGLAALTEYIQTFVPGRCGAMSDVLIDFSGFMISALVLSICIIATYFIKKALKNRKEKKSNQNQDNK